MLSPLDVVLYGLILLVSFACRLSSKHKLSIGRVSFSCLSLHDIRYTGPLLTKSHYYSFSCSRASLRFHLPWCGDHRWLTFRAEDLSCLSDEDHSCVGSITAVLWFFPRVFRQTMSAWASADLEDFCIQVHRSNSTPRWVKHIRATLVRAVLKGSILRADHFKTVVRTQEAPLSTPAPQELQSECASAGARGSTKLDRSEDGKGDVCETNNDGAPRARTRRDNHKKSPKPVTTGRRDVLCLSTYVRGLQIDDQEGRLFSFSRVDAQLRRDWTADNGKFVMIAEGCRWIKVHCAYTTRASARTGWAILTSIVSFPADLVSVWKAPGSAIDLNISRVDVTFDSFRIRDAELVAQAFKMSREKIRLDDIQWNDLLIDAFANTLIGSLRQDE